MELVREFRRMRAGEIDKRAFNDYSLNTKFTEVEALRQEAAALRLPPETVGAIAAFLGVIAGPRAASRSRSKRAVAAIGKTPDDSTKRTRRKSKRSV